MRGVIKILKIEDHIYFVRYKDKYENIETLSSVHHYNNKLTIVKEWDASKGFNLTDFDVLT